MPILVHSKRGESRAAAMQRAKERFVGQGVIYEGDEGDSSPSSGYPSQAGEVMNEYNNDKMKILKAINLMRMPWGINIKKAFENMEVAKRIDRQMISGGGLTRYLNPARLMSTAEMKLGHVFSISDENKWTINKYYNIISNLDNNDWTRGSTAGVTYTDEVSFAACISETQVVIDRSSFGEVRRLGFSAGEVMAQDMAEADRLAKAMKFPKLREGLTPNQRRAIGDVMKMANNGQNHLTRLVRGVLLALGAEMSEKKMIKLKNDRNRYEWCEYIPDTIQEVHEKPNSCAIWCNFPSRKDYSSIIAHFTQGWNCEGLPLRISGIKIPDDGTFTYVISLGAGVLHDVNATGGLIRSALTAYAQSMACEDVLEQAYCIGSMLLLHEHWPAVHLPATLWASDLIRPAMATKHEISRYKREWTVRESMVLAKYAVDVIGLVIKEVMSSCWEHNTETLEDAVSRISRGHLSSRNELYRWLIENIAGEGAGFIFNLDPFKDIKINRIKAINDTSCLKYWWIGEVKGVGGDSICSTLLCGSYSTLPSTGADTATARELALLRQIGVVKNGPLYKREIRLKKIEIDEDKKKVVDGCIKEGKISVVGGGMSVIMDRRRAGVKKTEWKAEAEESESKKYDDDDEDDNDDVDILDGMPSNWADAADNSTEKEKEKKEKEKEKEGDKEAEKEKPVDKEKEKEKDKDEEISRSTEERQEPITEKVPEREGTSEIRGEQTAECSSEFTELDRQEFIEDIRRDREDAKRVAEMRAERERLRKEKAAKELREEQRLIETGAMKMVPYTKERTRSIETSDREILSELFDSDEAAKKSEFWSSVKEKWVLESEFLLTNWRRRKISENTILRCCDLLKEIFPITSLHIGESGRAKADMVRLAGSLLGMMDMGENVQGDWDKNHFILQCWLWKYQRKWFNELNNQKISDIVKDMRKCRVKLSVEATVRWRMWAKVNFGAAPEDMATTERFEFEKRVRNGHEDSLVWFICTKLMLRNPTWRMDHSTVPESKRVLELLDLYIPKAA